MCFTRLESKHKKKSIWIILTKSSHKWTMNNEKILKKEVFNLQRNWIFFLFFGNDENFLVSPSVVIVLCLFVKKKTFDWNILRESESEKKIKFKATMPLLSFASKFFFSFMWIMREYNNSRFSFLPYDAATACCLWCECLLFGDALYTTIESKVKDEWETEKRLLSQFCIIM